METETKKTDSAKSNVLAKKRWLIWLKIGIAALVLTILVLKIDIHKIVFALKNARAWPIWLALILSGVNIYIQFCKWRFVVRFARPDVPPGEVLTSLFFGYIMGFVTPGRMGDVGRAFFIKKAPWQSTMGLAVVDKIYSVSLVYISGILGLLYLSPRFLPAGIYPLVVGVSLSLEFLLIYILLHPRKIQRLYALLNRWFPNREKVQLFINSLDRFTTRDGAILLGWSILFNLTFLTQFYLLILAFENIPIHLAYTAAASTFLAKSLLPISIGDLGIREGAAVFFFTAVGMASVTALNASLLIFIINVLLPSLVGFLLIFKSKLFAFLLAVKTWL